MQDPMLQWRVLEAFTNQTEKEIPETEFLKEGKT